MMLEILSPERTLYRGEAERVTLPGALGEFTVLPRHAPIISALVEGTIHYVPKGGQEQSLPVGGGFAEVKKDVVSVCVG